MRKNTGTSPGTQADRLARELAEVTDEQIRAAVEKGATFEERKRAEMAENVGGATREAQHAAKR